MVQRGSLEDDYGRLDVLLTACGRLCLHRKRINISTVLAGQRLGIKEVDEGIWLVSFMPYDLGYFDLEQKTLQPLDNPFGPRLYLCLRYDLSPMCPGWTIEALAEGVDLILHFPGSPP